jgi:hypothetical protein
MKCINIHEYYDLKQQLYHDKHWSNGYLKIQERNIWNFITASGHNMSHVTNGAKLKKKSSAKFKHGNLILKKKNKCSFDKKYKVHPSFTLVTISAINL